jgi:hypothetical protein
MTFAKFLSIICFASICSCTPLTEAERFERQYAHAEKMEKWYHYEQQCKNTVGYVWYCNADEQMVRRAPWAHCGCARYESLWR